MRNPDIIQHDYGQKTHQQTALLPDFPYIFNVIMRFFDSTDNIAISTAGIASFLIPVNTQIKCQVIPVVGILLMKSSRGASWFPGDRMDIKKPHSQPMGILLFVRASLCYQPVQIIVADIQCAADEYN